MRDFKFRAFVKGEMHYNIVLLDNHFLIPYGPLKNKIDFSKKTPISDWSDNELMQYTGLNDNDGDEIFEGDIVYIAGTGNMQVLFDMSAWCFMNKNNIYFFNEMEWDNVGKVVGNIHQNKNLI